jgi:hypothetical protein
MLLMSAVALRAAPCPIRYWHRTTATAASLNGALLVANNNWKDNQQAEIGATGIPPVNNREAATLITLPAAAYTAVVRGEGNTIGDSFGGSLPAH